MKKGLDPEAPGPAVQENPEDQSILARYRGGDREAIPDLVERYASRLFNFGLRMCGNTQDAQDMVQDTFLNVLRYLRGFRGETKLKNWLYRLASTACWRRRRRGYRRDGGDNRREAALKWEDLRPPSAQGAAMEVPAWSESPVETLMNDELRARLGRAISHLPSKYRLVFNLRDLEGFSTAEVARMLDLTEQTVKTRLHRARAFLRNELAEYYQGRAESRPEG
ncbi:MAG: sigma-70 family RNA polymerase sigma factor [Thermodesulfobacteriota bacterium]